MSDLTSPHYVKKTAHMFNSKVNGDKVAVPSSSPSPASTTPSYTTISKTVLGYTENLYYHQNSNHNTNRNINNHSGSDNSNGIKKSFIIQRIEKLYGYKSPSLTPTTPTTTARSSNESNNNYMGQLKSKDLYSTCYIQVNRPSSANRSVTTTLSPSARNGVKPELKPKPRKNGTYYLTVLKNVENKMKDLCIKFEKELEEGGEEEKNGRIRNAIGKSKLLCNKKFIQFKELCQQNLEEETEVDGEADGTKDSGKKLKPTDEDLAGFWDMVLIQVNDVYSLFDSIEQSASSPGPMNGKDTADSASPVKYHQNAVSPAEKGQEQPKKKSSLSPKKKPLTSTNKTAPSALQKQKAEERRKLLQLKREEMKNNNIDSNNDIQIFIK